MMIDHTVLLLGADGYIGNALTQRLLFQGYKVVGIDNLLRRQWIKQDMDSFCFITHITTAIKRSRIGGGKVEMNKK